MPAAKGPPDPDIHLLVGQLLEATKTSSEAVRQLAIDATATAKLLAGIVTTLGRVESEVRELTKIVRTGDVEPSLVAGVSRCAERLSRCEQSLSEIDHKLDDITMIGGTAFTYWQVVRYSFVFGGWLVPTVIAVYALVK